MNSMTAQEVLRLIRVLGVTLTAMSDAIQKEISK